MTVQDSLPMDRAAAATRSRGDAVLADAQAEGRSYVDILKSSVLIGGSSAINIAIGVVRTKALAMLLGPAGYGVLGALTLIAELARSVAQVGLNSSGVRQIADAVATGDSNRVALTVVVLRRVSLLCALLGAILLATLAAPVSQLTFESTGHAESVATLSLAVFFSVVAGGQGALLQGMRRIADMARITVLGGALSTLVAIPMVYTLGERGLAPTLVVSAAISAAASWWYSRQIRVVAPRLSLGQVSTESTNLLKLGMAFMASGLLTVCAAYTVRIIVLRHDGLEAAGIYYAAWTLGSMYIGFILQAMGTDFYPRLVGVANDNTQCNRLANEQAQVSILLAVPGILLTLVLAPPIISFFYSAQFSGAVDVLRWICLGMTLRVLTWPIGFIVIAKNRQLPFFLIEFSWAAANVGLTWWFVGTMGVVGAGVAFFASYVFYALLVYGIARRLTGFRWSSENIKNGLALLPITTVAFLCFVLLSTTVATCVGLLAFACSSTYAIVTIRSLIPAAAHPGAFRWIRRHQARR